MDITLFEINLDGAQFGPATIGDPTGGKRAGRERMDEETTVVTDADESARSRSFARFAPLFVVVGVAVGYTAVRRFRGSGSTDLDAEHVEIAA